MPVCRLREGSCGFVLENELFSLVRLGPSRRCCCHTLGEGPLGGRWGSVHALTLTLSLGSQQALCLQTAQPWPVCSPVYPQCCLLFLGLIPLPQTPKVFPVCSSLSCSHPRIDHARFYGFASGPLLIILSAVFSVPMTGWFLSPDWTLTGASVLCLQCQAHLAVVCTYRVSHGQPRRCFTYSFHQLQSSVRA